MFSKYLCDSTQMRSISGWERQDDHDNAPNGEANLTSPVCDQAELMGLLIKLHNLNLELLAVQRVGAVTAFE